MFDYIFYRLYSYYDKKEKGSTPVSTAAMYLSFLQILMIFSIYMIADITLDGKVGIWKLPINEIYLKIGIVVFAILVDLLNFLKYKKQHKTLVSKFRNHPLNAKFKVWMLYFIGAGLLILPFLYKEILGLF